MSGRLVAQVTDVACLAVLLLLGLAGFATTYGGHRYLLSGGAGLVLGIIVALLAHRLRQPVVTVAAAALLAFAAFGAAATDPAQPLPTAATLTDLALGAVRGWKELLTTLPPVGDAGHLLVIPYLCALACGAVGLTLALRVRSPFVPLLAPVALLAVVILFGVRQPASLLLQGAAFAAVAVLWAAVRHRRLRPVLAGGSTAGGGPAGGGLANGGLAGGGRRAARLGGAAGLLAAAAAGALLIGPHLPYISERPRLILREHTTPPFDPSAYPSPLGALRRYEVRQKKTALFTVDGLPAGARIRLATLDAYDGLVWNVAAGDGLRGDTSGRFERVGRSIPAAVAGTRATVGVRMGAYDDVWLPDVGATTAVRFAGDRADVLTESFRYNRATGTGVVPARLRRGDRYTLDVVIPAHPPDSALGGRAPADIALPDLAGVPAAVRTSAADWTTGVSGSAARVQALVSKLRAGAYSDGTGSAGVQSRPGHGAGRIAEFLGNDQLVGDAEQYAATLALLARDLDLPARVVLGVVPPSGWDGVVTGALVTAWVEVDFDGVGWVSVDPTPPVTNKPKPQKPKDEPKTRAPARQPPLVLAQPPAQLPPPDLQSQRTSTGDRPPFGLPRWVLLAGLYGGVPLAGLGGFAGLIVGVKARRRQLRRTRGSTARRIGGGWRELVDRARDHGAVPPPAATRSQAAAAIGTPSAAPLAARADAAVFGSGEPSEDVVRGFWAEIDRAVGELGADRTRLQRARAAVSVASLGRSPALLRPVLRFRRRLMREVGTA